MPKNSEHKPIKCCMLHIYRSKYHLLQKLWIRNKVIKHN